MADARNATAPSRRRRAEQPSRREVILHAAVDLFHRRGFHATGIDDIGAAAGISGPAVYRHFANKDDILVTAFARTWERLMEGAAVARTLEPEGALGELISSHIRVALDSRALLSLWNTEQRHLPPSYQREAYRRQGRYLDQWIDTLLKVRPELAREQARLAVHATQAMLQFIVYFEYDLSRDELESRAKAMAEAVLFAEPDAGG